MLLLLLTLLLVSLLSTNTQHTYRPPTDFSGFYHQLQREKEQLRGSGAILQQQQELDSRAGSVHLQQQQQQQHDGFDRSNHQHEQQQQQHCDQDTLGGEGWQQQQLQQNHNQQQQRSTAPTLEQLLNEHDLNSRDKPPDRQLKQVGLKEKKDFTQLS